jgi:tetratricopeptide (TPR) repeat protein
MLTVLPRRFGWCAPAVLLMGCLFAAELLAETASSPYLDVRRLIDAGHYRDAERLIGAHLQQHRSDSTGIGMLALILDFEGRHDEAERCFQKGLRIAPGSVFLLNNLGRHYASLQRVPEARDAFAKVLAIDSFNAFALIELSQLDLDTKNAGSALGYLDRLPAAVAEQPTTTLLRAQALHLTGNDAAAANLLDNMEAAGPSRASLYFSAGLLLAECRHYREAQRAFVRALEADPASFNIEYNLGVASAEAGDLDRAREIFEHALARRSNDVDCMLQLALVYQQKQDFDRSLPILMRATGLAPKRVDILRAIAFATEKLGMYGDTAQAWNRYLQIQPDDDIARRERGFALASSDQLDKGLEDLRWFQRRHPEDVEGLYELAIAEAVGEPDQALGHLNTAIHENPSSLPARYARASLEYRHEDLQQAEEDAEYVVKRAPQNVRAINLLARINLRENRTEDAFELLAGGLKIAPGDPQLLLYYSQVLRRLGRANEAGQALAKLKVARSTIGQPSSEASAFDLYREPPGERRSQYLEGLRREIVADPENPSLRLALASALLSENDTGEAVRELRSASRLSGDPAVQARCGRELLKAGHPAAAAEFLRSAAARTAPSDNLLYDLAVAEFHAAGASVALAALDRIPNRKRSAECYLLRAEILDAAHRSTEAVASLVEAQGARYPEDARPEFYLEWSGMLLMHEKGQDALEVLRQGEKAFPRRRELLLGEAVVNSLRNDSETASKILASLESQWPEWSRLHLVKGAVLAKRGDVPGALNAFKVATTMAPAMGGAACYMASALLHGSSVDRGKWSGAAFALVDVDPDHPFCRLLAGTIAHSTEDYKAALLNLTPVVAAHPGWKEGHIALRDIYRALGRPEDAAREENTAEQASGPAAPEIGGPLAAAGLMGATLRIPAAVADAVPTA